MDGFKFYLMNGSDALTRICFKVKNKTGSRNTSGFYYLVMQPFLQGVYLVKYVISMFVSDWKD